MAHPRMTWQLGVVTATTAVAAMSVGLAGVADASPTFDADGYSTCTATTVPGPDEGFDAVVTRCCVEHAGVPADTRYGVGCVAAVDNPSIDYRPTIVMPSRATPPEDGESALNSLINMPIPLPSDEALPQP